MKSIKQYQSFIKKSSFLSAFFLIIVCLHSCKDEKVIEEEKFVKIYSSLVIAKDTLKSPQTPVQDKIFSQYGVTKEEYEKTVEYYNEDPERWEKFFNKVIENVTALQKKEKRG